MGGAQVAIDVRGGQRAELLTVTRCGSRRQARFGEAREALRRASCIGRLETGKSKEPVSIFLYTAADDSSHPTRSIGP